MQSLLFGGARVGLVGDAAYLVHAHALCASAHERLWVTQFVADGRVSSDGEGIVLELCHALAEAHHRGVDVRVVHDDLRKSLDAPELNAAFRRFLTSRGVPVRIYGGFDDERLGRGSRKRRTQRRRHSLHAKMLLCDDTSALVGNHNWTGGAFGAHCEMSLSIASRDALRAVVERTPRQTADVAFLTGDRYLALVTRLVRRPRALVCVLVPRVRSRGSTRIQTLLRELVAAKARGADVPLILTR